MRLGKFPCKADRMVVAPYQGEVIMFSMRKILAVVTVAVFAVGIYSYFRDRESLKIKKEMLRLVGDLDLTNDQRARARGMVESLHVSVFARSLDISRDRGKKFDAKAYQDEMFARMIERAKTADADLAERLSTQQRHHELVVSEN